MAMERSVVHTEAAPKAVGPYSQAIRCGEMVFTAGQVAIDPAVGGVVAESIEDQTRQVLTNLKAVLEAAGSGLDLVVKCTVFLTDMAEFARMNAVYGEFFPSAPPARSAVQVSALPLGVKVEIEAVALVR
jgi:2-iminobutanoate/2-iminopropanoate deaminase